MSSAGLFVLIVIVLAVLAMLVVFHSPRRMIDYFKTREGKGVLKGIVLFVGLGIVVALASTAFAIPDRSSGTWLAYGEIFLGLDNTNHQSPMCEDGNNSSRLTSNGGFRFNIYQSADRAFELNSKYTHHSCAFNPDDQSYDAIGLEATYKFWTR